MQGILPYLISGISVGGQYALIAIGSLTLPTAMSLWWQA